MKILWIVVLIIIVLFIAIQVFSMYTNRGVEQYPYQVLKVYKQFELRQYEGRLFTTIQLTSNRYEEVSGKGFSALAGYIFGGNDRKEKIAMTSPVAMSLGDSMTMMFMVPSSLNDSLLPKPDNKSIVFKQMPPKKMAAITFGGWANSNSINEHKNKLIQLLKKEKIAHKNNFYFLGYNPPYETFNRKNEIIVELEE
jgi:hypothetical protein